MASETLEVTDPPPPIELSAEVPTEETPEQIEARLLQRQQNLAGKLNVLEQQTLGSIRDTIGSVTDTVNSVQSVVADPVGAVQSAVQSAVMNPLGDIANGMTSSVSDMVQKFDPTDLIRRHPLEAVGVAVAGGVVVSMLLNGQPHTAAAGASPNGAPSLLQTLTNSFRSELTALGRQLFDTVSQSLIERVKQTVSGQANPPPPMGSISTEQQRV